MISPYDLKSAAVWLSYLSVDYALVAKQAIERGDADGAYCFAKIAAHVACLAQRLGQPAVDTGVSYTLRDRLRLTPGESEAA